MDLKKTLLRLSDVTHGRISSSQTFSDFLAYSALRLSIRTDPVHCKERSERLRRLEANYEESELREFLAELTVICEAVKHNVDVGDWADLFADAYMEVRARNENLKQEFTPKGVAALMSRFVFRDNCALPEKGYFTLSDHACGSGTLLLRSEPFCTPHLWPQMRKTGDYRLSGNLLFCLLVAPAPKPLFRRISFCSCAPFRRFSLPPSADIFRKRRGWFTSMVANWFVDGNGIFQKSVRLVEP